MHKQKQSEKRALGNLVKHWQKWRTRVICARLVDLPSSLGSPYLKLIDSDPTIRWKPLEHGHQELEAAGPVADQEHHADKVEYSHENARHVQELKEGGAVTNC